VATDGSVDFIPGPASTTVRFEGLPPGAKRVEVWLPHAASVVLGAVRIDDGATATAPSPEERRRWIHYGSSISHCLEALRPTGVWPVVASRLAGVVLDSLAFAGQCQLDQLVARTIRDLPADVISMKVGINLVNADSMRERTFAPAVHGFLDTVRDGHQDTPILVVTPILCPAHEGAPGPTNSAGAQIAAFDRPVELALGALTIGRIRELLAAIVAARQAAGDGNLHLLDGRQLFGEDDLGDLPDGLHPNAAGYLRMGERFAELAFAPGAPLA
jgi:lysophospholipase L1-like esterase